MNPTFNEGTIIGDAKVIRETDKAILVILEDDREVWIPKSVIHDNSEVWSEQNGSGMLVVAAWWAERNGY